MQTYYSITKTGKEEIIGLGSNTIDIIPKDDKHFVYKKISAEKYLELNKTIFLNLPSHAKN